MKHDMTGFRAIVPAFDLEERAAKLAQTIEHLERENRYLRVRVNDLKEENQDLKRKQHG